MKKVLGLLLALVPSIALGQNAGWPPPAGAIAFLCVYNVALPNLTTGQVGFAQCDSHGQLLVSGGGGGGGLSVVDQTAWTQGTSAFTPSGGVYNDTATLSSGQEGTARLTTKRAQIVDVDSIGNQLHTDITSAVPWLATTAWSTNSYSNGTTNPGAADLHGAPFADLGAVGGAAYSLGQTTKASSLSVTFASDQTAADPCKFQAKINVPISTTTSISVVSGISAQKAYICSFSLIANAAAVVSLVEGSGTVCATTPVAIMGSTTAASGLSFATNGGMTLGNGGATIGASGTAANSVCLIKASGTPLVAGNLTYVQQ